MGLSITHMEPMNSHTEGRSLLLEEESQWILAAQQDLRHFEPLYQRYYRPIYEYIYRRCDDKNTVADITAITFEKAMLSIGKFKIQGFPFGSWLYRIAASELGNYYRQQKKERKIWVQTEGVQEIAMEIESKLADEDNLKQLLRALEHLKPDDVEIIVMRYFEKRSFTEIAGYMDTNESNARVRLHRILGRLKDAFNKEGRA